MLKHCVNRLVIYLYLSDCMCGCVFICGFKFYNIFHCKGENFEYNRNDMDMEIGFYWLHKQWQTIAISIEYISIKSYGYSIDIASVRKTVKENGSWRE